MRGDSSGCASPLLLCSFRSLPIDSACIYHQETLAYSNRMVLRCSCITSPVLFHPFIPPSHTIFMLLLNLADCQFPGLLFHQVAFFHYLPDGSPTLLLHPRHSFFHFLFTSLFALFHLPLFLPMQVSLSLSLSIPLSLTHCLSVHRRCNWSTTFPHIVIFKSPLASQRRESDCFIIFRFPDMVLGR